MPIKDFLLHGSFQWSRRPYRFVGLRKDWHDGPIWSFGFYWFHFSSFGFDYDAWESAFNAGYKIGREAPIKVIAELIRCIENDHLIELPADLSSRARALTKKS